jgi:hypothetical protein
MRAGKLDRQMDFYNPTITRHAVTNEPIVNIGFPVARLWCEQIPLTGQEVFTQGAIKNFRQVDVRCRENPLIRGIDESWIIRDVIDSIKYEIVHVRTLRNQKLGEMVFRCIVTGKLMPAVQPNDIDMLMYTPSLLDANLVFTQR